MLVVVRKCNEKDEVMQYMQDLWRKDCLIILVLTTMSYILSLWT
jgi:hypothetical protein